MRSKRLTGNGGLRGASNNSDSSRDSEFCKVVELEPELRACVGDGNSGNQAGQLLLE